MWGNLANNLSNVVEAAKKQIDELEQQLDAAVEQDTEGLTAEDLPDMDGLLVQQQSQINTENKEDDGGGVSTLSSSAESAAVGSKNKNLKEDEEVVSEKTLTAHHGWNMIKQVAGTMTEEDAEKVETGERERRDSQMRRLKETHERALKKVETKHQEQLTSLQSTLAHAKKETEQTKLKLSEAHKHHKTTLDTEKDELTTSLTSKYESELLALATAHSQTKHELEALSKSHTETNEAREADKARHQEQRRSSERELADWKARHAEQQAELEAAMKALESSYEGEKGREEEEVEEGGQKKGKSKKEEKGSKERVELAARCRGLEARLREAEKCWEQERERHREEEESLRGQLQQLHAQAQQGKEEEEEREREREREREKEKEKEREKEEEKERLKVELAESKARLAPLSEALDAAHSKLDAQAEVLAERERALLASQTRLQEAEEERQRESERERERERSTEAQAKAKEEGEGEGESSLQAEVERLRQEDEDKGSRLAAFEREGQVLAKKHADMLSSVRKGKAELKDKDKALAAATREREGLERQLGEVRGRLQQVEKDANTASRSLSAVQVANQTSGDKLAKLELELAAKAEEVQVQKKALDEAWEALNEAKREVADHKATVQALRQQLGEENSRLKATEEGQRSVASREAVLRTNATQLQDSLQRHMAESSAREGRLRDELKDMRARWHEVVAAREALAGEVATVSTPLLQQISKLQDALRAKGEAWATLESSLSERALRAESGLEVALSKREWAEEQLGEARLALDTANTRLAESLEGQRQVQGREDAAKASLERAFQRAAALEADLAAASASKLSLELAHKEGEGRVQSLEGAVRDKEEALDRAQEALQGLQEEREQEQLLYRSSSGYYSGSKGRDSRAHTPLIERASSSSDWGRGDAGNNNDNSNGGSYSSSEGLGLTQDRGGRGDGEEGATTTTTTTVSHSHSSGKVLRSLALPGVDLLPSGELSYAASLRLEQSLQRREEEADELAGKVRSLETAREALLKEVTFLSSRNNQLEEGLVQLPETERALTEARKRADLLLLMVGEKDEEIEALLGDLADTKALYRQEMDTLLSQLAPSSSAEAKGV